MAPSQVSPPLRATSPFHLTCIADNKSNMGLFTELPTGLDEVDVIIAGGGTAGCVVASRLSDTDPDLSILIIEGGTNNKVPNVTYPVLFPTNLSPAGKATLFYKGAKEEQLGGREVIVESGGILGGGSSINIMTYTRAQRCDFDAWNTPGWSGDEMLPYVKKVINFITAQNGRLRNTAYFYNSSKPTTAPPTDLPMATTAQSTSPGAHTTASSSRKPSSKSRASSDGPRRKTYSPWTTTTACLARSSTSPPKASVKTSQPPICTPGSKTASTRTCTYF
jgi:choline dehydrogenase-like flavoprotein